MYNPLVSIIIPVYNCEKYIKDTINSVLNNNYENIEIICIDDGSCDNSLKIIEELSIKNSKIKYFHQENQGVSIARNNGLHYAKGKYVMFVDADDLIMPATISKSASYLEKHNADIICFNMLIRSENRSDFVCFDDEHFDSDVKICNSKDYSKAINFTNAAVSIIKKDFLDKYKINFIPNHIYEDWVFMGEVFTNNPMCVFLNEPLYIYNRKNNSSITCNVSSKCLDLFDSYKIANTIIENRNLNPSWLKINDLKILKESLSLLLNKVLKSKKTDIFAQYCQAFKETAHRFNLVYMESLLSNENETFKITAEYILNNKSFNKFNLKKLIHKRKMQKAFIVYISNLCSYLYYSLKGIINNG